ALVGFSQGTMMSLHVGLRRLHPCAGILGYSGRLIAPDLLEAEIRSRPPILLIHGDADAVVPFESLDHAVRALTQRGLPVRSHACPGLDHAIDQEGVLLGSRFLHEAFSG